MVSSLAGSADSPTISHQRAKSAQSDRYARQVASERAARSYSWPAARSGERPARGSGNGAYDLSFASLGSSTSGIVGRG